MTMTPMTSIRLKRRCAGRTGRLATVACGILVSTAGLSGCVAVEQEEASARKVRIAAASLVVDGAEHRAAASHDGRTYAADELERFTSAAELTDAQRSAMQLHLDRFERHYAGLGRSRAPGLVDRLKDHTRVLIARELSPAQVALFDEAVLPGSRAFAATAQQGGHR